MHKIIAFSLALLFAVARGQDCSVDYRDDCGVVGTTEVIQTMQLQFCSLPDVSLFFFN